MSATKIINVLKDDSFDEILDLFTSTPADEVIFVLPKRARAFSKEEHFKHLREEANKSDKEVSFLCSNPDLNDLAKQYRFDVLLSRSPEKKRSKAPSDAPINVVNQIEELYGEPITTEDSVKVEDAVVLHDDYEEPEVVTTRMEDITHRKAEEPQHVQVAARREREAPVEISPSFQSDKLEHRAINEIRGIWAEEPRVVSRRSYASTHSAGHGYKKGLAGLLIAALLVGGAIVYVSTGSAQISIIPQSQSLDFQLKASAVNSISSVDTASNRIPGQLFTIQKSITASFTATGFKDVAQKARGTITVYNELSSAQPLIATTRFSSPDGLIFRTLTAVSVPASKTENGKVLPGEASVQVIADKAGQTYNIPAGSFTVIAFKEKGDTEKFQKVYGKSSAAMHGGTSGQAKVVTESDYNAAKEALNKELTGTINQELNSEVEGFKVLSDSLIKFGVPEASAGIDEAADNFTMTLSGTLQTIGFKEADALKLVQNYVENQYHLVTLPEKLSVSYDQPRPDESGTVMGFTLSVKGPGFAKIDSSKVITALLGKKEADIKTYLKDVPGVKSAKVVLSPLWVRSVPKDAAKAQIRLEY
ncbi:baseplate J/gp47 family protein [Candidatus Parcubacteria bacterium]|nr:baseplate J/gp47 family protein [Candidatus Parcubacteria bacterium]